MTWMRALIDKDYRDEVVMRLSWLDGHEYRDSWPEIREGVRLQQAYSLCINGDGKEHPEIRKFVWYNWG